jgi:hypothetical protein
MALSAALLSSLALSAWSKDDSCSASNFHSDGMVGHAELREQRLASAGENYINPGMNGSIKVHGWANNDVQVKACIQAAAESESEAAALAQQVNITSGPGQIAAKGPTSHDHSWWSVSYEVWVPESANVKMEAHNGSITVDGVHGTLRFNTLNGSVKLSGVGGDITGRTTNGSVTVELEGSGWKGSGMDVSTTNGSVRLNLPENFSANVEASTVNGSLRTDFPVTVSGEIKNHLTFVLGSGGPTIKATTVNGSVHIGRRSA